jgi:hypothetical protein
MDLQKYFYESASVKQKFIDAQQELFEDVIEVFLDCFSS